MASVKWGIIGAGNISHDFCLALKTLPPNEHDIKAVAARSSERSRRFAEKFGIEKAYGTYDELIQDCDVDIVYIGTLNSSHKELSIKAILNDKHVLCEKPAAMNSKDLEDILATAKRTSSVVFMEVSVHKGHAHFSSVARVFHEKQRSEFNFTFIDVFTVSA